MRTSSRARRHAGSLSLATLALAGACADPVAGPLASGVTPSPLFDKSGGGSTSQSSQQYVVIYKDGASDLATSASATGAVKLGNLRNLNGAVYDGVTDPEALRGDPNVASVSENFLSYPTAAYPTSAVYWARGWQWDMKQIKADQTPSTVRGANTKVCIVDSGIDKSHQDLAGKVVAEASFVDVAHGYPGPGASPAPLDSNGHGSHVAGTVTTNGIGTASVAPEAKLMAAKVFAGGTNPGATLAAIWDAIAWCGNNNADVINMSLGGLRARPLNAARIADSVQYAKVIDDVRKQGTVVVVSAGNDNLQLDASNPALQYAWPAQIPGTVTVGATATTSANAVFPFAVPAPNAIWDNRASYSNYGADVDTWAPGGINFVNRVQANITSVCSSYITGGGCAGGKLYRSISGTSMASPHVAGLAALITGRTAAPRGLARTQAVEGCIYSTGDNITINGVTRPRINALRAATEACSGI